MAFKPQNSGGGERTGDYEPMNRPVPKAGSRKARVSLIIDLGIQNQEDYEDEKTGEKKPRKPAHQVAVFADLVNDIVDYGGDIGEQQYRLPLNKEFQRVFQGINFSTVAPKDADGNTIKGKPWGLHPRNALYLLAKAVGKDEITYEGKHKESLDISLLLNQPFLAQVEVKRTPHKEGKKDKDGNPIVYTNVSYKGPSPIPTVEDEETGEEKPMKVAELRQKPLCLTFDDVKAADIQSIRPSLIKQIKLANNYIGSQMQRAIEEYEQQSGAEGEDEDEQPKKEVSEKAKPAKAAPKAKPKAAPVEDEDEEDIPF